MPAYCCTSCSKVVPTAQGLRLHRYYKHSSHGARTTNSQSAAQHPSPIEPPAKRRRVESTHIEDGDSSRAAQSDHSHANADYEPNNNADHHDDNDDNDDAPPLDRRARVEEVEDEERNCYVERIPHPVAVPTHRSAETPFHVRRREVIDADLPPWHPFASKEEWEFAYWMAKSGLSHAKMDDLLKLQIASRMNLSFKDQRKFFEKVDSLPQSAAWACELITVFGETPAEGEKQRTEELELWFRNPLECIQELLADVVLGPHLVFEPVKYYTDAEGTARLYSEAWTGDWWWGVQLKLPHGATVIPIIISTDKTNLTLFNGDKEAYPVYLSIGNIPKAMRRSPKTRATVLIGYLPTSKLKIFPKAVRFEKQCELFHYCMAKILAPLRTAGKDGVSMALHDGVVLTCYPILAAYVADQPEQALVACTKKNRCHMCKVSVDGMGHVRPGEPRTQADTEELLTTAVMGGDGDAQNRMRRDGVRATYPPFWMGLPHVDIHQCFTPDLLHQLHKGVFGEHLLDWCISVVGEAEVDRRFASLPDHPALRHFPKGISCISQFNGKEYKNVERVFIGVVAGVGDKRVAQAAEGLLDFIYYASFPVHSATTLDKLEDSHRRFHEHKDVFVELGARSPGHYNFPKLHTMCHYAAAIRQLGTADGYNTEASERLHIDYAKVAYHASNRKEYTKQMTTWLSRREAVERFACYLHWLETSALPATDESSDSESDDGSDEEENDNHGPLLPERLRLPKRASFPRQTADNIEKTHGAEQFLCAVNKHLDRTTGPDAPRACSGDRFNVYKRVKIYTTRYGEDETDLIRASPPTAKGPAHFDTALTSLTSGGGLLDHEVVRVRTIFTLPPRFKERRPLAYVEVFTKMRQDKALGLNLWQVSHSTQNHRRRVTVIPLENVRSSCHLLPQYGQEVDRSWTSDTVLNACRTFYINEYLSRRTFGMG